MLRPDLAVMVDRALKISCLFIFDERYTSTENIRLLY